MKTLSEHNIPENAEETTTATQQTAEVAETSKKGFKDKAKEKFKNNTKLGQWLYANPKKFFIYAVIFFSISLLANIIKDIYAPPKPKRLYEIPEIVQENKHPNATQYNLPPAMKDIVDELKQLKTKWYNKTLSKSDSLRIEYLYNQYQILKDAKE